MHKNVGFRHFGFALWIVTSLFAFLAQAGDRGEAGCTQADVRDFQSAQVREFYSTPRHQGDSNWCYAFATSDLLADRLGEPVSAYSVALNYNDHLTLIDRAWRGVEDWFEGENSVLDNGGVAQEALRLTLDSGSTCSEARLPSNLFAKNSFQKFISNISSHYESEDVDATVKLLKTLVPQTRESIVIDQVKASLAAQEDLLHLLLRLEKRSCAPAVVMSKGLDSSQVAFSTDSPMRLVETSLAATNRPRPIAILFASSSVYKENSESPLADFFGDHVSVVIGRRWSRTHQSCEYLVRDSFGTDCTQYREHVQCLGNGQYWIQDRDLRKMLISATAFQTGQ